MDVIDSTLRRQNGNKHRDRFSREVLVAQDALGGRCGENSLFAYFRITGTAIEGVAVSEAAGR
jgi:hypothetical protein